MHRSTLWLLLALSTAALPAQSTICQSLSNNNIFQNNNSMGGPNLWLGLKLQTSATPLVATRVEMWTGEQTGTNSVSLWTHDAVNNKPLVNLGTASWSMARPNGWQGANFSAPILIAPTTTFWLVWAPINGAQSSIEVAGVPGPEYRGSFDNGQNWNGPFSMNLWKYRIYCGGTPGQYEVYGTACGGVSRRLPQVGFAGLPTIGQSTSILIESGVPSGNAFLAIGGSDTNWGALALPVDLTPIGAAGCFLRVSLDVTLATPLDVNGQASLPLSIPANAGLVGLPFYNQWLVLDPAANALQLVFSNGGRARIGN